MSRPKRVSPVWFLSLGLGVVAIALAPLVLGIDAPIDRPSLGWPVVAVGFYLAEIAVLHLRFRQDAQSFSMSEVAIAVGLFFADPIDLLVGQLIGNAAALVINRRQPPVKLAFNLTQVTLQVVVAIGVFQVALGDGEPLGPRGWAAALAGTIAALIVADTAINAAIRLAGGSLSRGELWTVRWVSLAGTTMNTILGVIIALVWSTQPAAVVLALAPPVMLFLAYRAYTSQRSQQARFDALQRTAQSLLRAHTLTDVAGVAAEQARMMFETAYAEVAIYATENRPEIRGIAQEDEETTIVRPPSPASPSLPDGARLLEGASLASYVSHDGIIPTSGIVTSLEGERGQVGFVLVANPLSDVSQFVSADLGLLETLAGQIGPIIENERLGGEVAALSQLVESRNEVLAAVSHEVRSPLATVVSAASTLERRMAELTPENRQVLIDLIRKNSQELTEIVDDILVAARSDTAPEAIETGPVDPASEVAAVLTGLVELSDDTPVKGAAGVALADPTRLRQILRNLLTNAVRYGGDTIWVELDEQPGSIGIAVCDDGDGVPAEHASDIFEPYVSAHGDRSRPQALGLGLAISRRLARLMDGDVTYERIDGVTRFRLSLVRASAH